MLFQIKLRKWFLWRSYAITPYHLFTQRQKFYLIIEKLSNTIDYIYL